MDAPGRATKTAPAATPVVRAHHSEPDMRKLTTRTRRRITYAGAAIAVIAATVFALRPTPVDVDIGSVERGPIRVTTEAEGVTRVRERYTISAPIAGRVARMTLREGERVAAGAVVAQIAPAPVDPRTEAQGEARLGSAQSLLSEANARVEQARAAQVQAAREAERRKVLAEAGAISREAREQAELAATLRQRELEAAEAGARAAQAEVQAARAALMNTSSDRASTAGLISIRSPVAGRVLRLPDRSERIVAAGTSLVELAEATGLEVVLDLLSTDAVAVSPGMPLLITGWGGADTLSGQVRSVEPSAFTKLSALGVEEQRVRVIGDLPAVPAGLGDGFRVEAAVVLSDTPDALRVPTNSVVPLPDGSYVFLVERGRARLRRFEPGRSGAGLTEVVTGLEEGDSVVLYPSDQVADGARVE